MRRRGPGLVGMAARTAVVAGTATAVSGRVARRQQGKAMEQQQEQQAAVAEAPPPPAAPASTEDPVQQLEKLADMKNQGLINDEEFAAMKAKIMG